jgi:alanyl-tRNA synthetase
LSVGDVVLLHVDNERRFSTMLNHTSTHLLNFALLDHCTESDQRGSLVDPDKLRFDFSNNSPLTADQLRKCEEKVNAIIDSNVDVYAELVPLHVGKAVKGVRAIFNEAYPDPVRVISVGVTVSDAADAPPTSIEFCGGTHVQKTGHIGRFIIASEEGIAKGVRRIVALTGLPAQLGIKRAEELENKVNELSKNPVLKSINELNEEINSSVISSWQKESLRKRLATLKKALDDAERQRKANAGKKIQQDLADKLAQTPPGEFYIEYIPGANQKILDASIKQIVKVSESTNVLLLTHDEARVNVLAFVSPQGIKKGLSANKWIQTVVKALPDGKGGGKDNSAQCAGSYTEGVVEQILTLANSYTTQ